MHYYRVPLVESGRQRPRRDGSPMAVKRHVGFDQTATKAIMFRDFAIVGAVDPIADARAVKFAEGAGERLGMASRIALRALSDGDREFSGADLSWSDALAGLMKNPPAAWGVQGLKPSNGRKPFAMERVGGRLRRRFIHPFLWTPQQRRRAQPGYRIWLDPQSKEPFYFEATPRKHASTFAYTPADDDENVYGEVADLDGHRGWRGLRVDDPEWFASAGWSISNGRIRGNPGTSSTISAGPDGYASDGDIVSIAGVWHTVVTDGLTAFKVIPATGGTGGNAAGYDETAGEYFLYSDAGATMLDTTALAFQAGEYHSLFREGSDVGLYIGGTYDSEAVIATSVLDQGDTYEFEVNVVGQGATTGTSTFGPFELGDEIWYWWKLDDVIKAVEGDYVPTGTLQLVVEAEAGDVLVAVTEVYRGDDDTGDVAVSDDVNGSWVQAAKAAHDYGSSSHSITVHYLARSAAGTVTVTFDPAGTDSWGVNGALLVLRPSGTRKIEILGTDTWAGQPSGTVLEVLGGSAEDRMIILAGLRIIPGGGSGLTAIDLADGNELSRYVDPGGGDGLFTGFIDTGGADPAAVFTWDGSGFPNTVAAMLAVRVSAIPQPTLSRDILFTTIGSRTRPRAFAPGISR